MYTSFVGLSSREIVQCFKHRLLALFKLMLLERRVSKMKTIALLEGSTHVDKDFALIFY